MAQLWGGRFTKETDRQVYAFNASIGFDRKLLKEDLEGSRALVKMLAKQGIITDDDRMPFSRGLTALRGMCMRENFPSRRSTRIYTALWRRI